MLFYHFRRFDFSKLKQFWQTSYEKTTLFETDFQSFYEVVLFGKILPSENFLPFEWNPFSLLNSISAVFYGIRDLKTDNSIFRTISKKRKKKEKKSKIFLFLRNNHILTILITFSESTSKGNFVKNTFPGFADVGSPLTFKLFARRRSSAISFEQQILQTSTKESKN